MSLRLPDHVCIIIPSPDGTPKPLTLRRASWACRIAFLQGLIPVYPPFLYTFFANPDEWDKLKVAVYKSWVRRCSHVWISFPEDDREALDECSYDVLTMLSDPARKDPVVERLWETDEGAGASLEELDYHEIRDLIRCNLDVGVLKGCA